MIRRTGSIAVVLAMMLSGCAAPSETASATLMESPASTVDINENMSLLNFVKEDTGRTIDLTNTAYLVVGVDHCEYGEPRQYIYDADIIRQAVQAVTAMYITGLKDNLSSTGDSSGVGFYDSNDKTLGSFTFQDGLYVGKNGRYSITGTGSLWNIDGIMGLDKWDAYWKDEEDKETDFEYEYQLVYPADIFLLSGYQQSKLNDISASDILSVTVKLKSSEVESERTDDPSVIEAVYNALSNMRATKKSSAGSVSADWTIRIAYQKPEETFASSTYLSFYGKDLISDLVEGGDYAYTVTGMDELLDCDMANLKYLKEKLN